VYDSGKGRTVFFYSLPYNIFICNVIYRKKLQAARSTVPPHARQRSETPYPAPGHPSRNTERRPAMNLNLTPLAVEGIRQLQNNPDLFIEILEDIENFILENIEVEKGDDLSFYTISNIKDLRLVRKILTKIGQDENAEPS
jgi:hypothetical protein